MVLKSGVDRSDDFARTLQIDVMLTFKIAVSDTIKTGALSSI